MLSKHAAVVAAHLSSKRGGAASCVCAFCLPLPCAKVLRRASCACEQGMVDIDTELLIMSEEGMLSGFCDQSEAELRATLRRAKQLHAPRERPVAAADGAPT